ncbi:hypothetical protein [Empedobacter brevis]|uniref:hypothetical protein n=1 Tax=Empedobacter brevis TaxID=247 RepID=UPI00289B80F3|nr:hypothetical protein [Empedobacter brevis]
MKKNPSLVGLLIVCGLAALIIIIYNVFLSKKDGYIIDNPSNKTLVIKINDKDFTIAPQQNARVDLAKGKAHIIYTFNNKNVDTVVTITRANGFINPTGQEYYTFTRPYGVRKNKDSIFLSNNIAIDNKIYHGIIEKSSQLYIENFYYNIDQDYPKMFIKSAGSEKATDLSKIFSKEDFKQFYFENYE